MMERPLTKMMRDILFWLPNDGSWVPREQLDDRLLRAAGVGSILAAMERRELVDAILRPVGTLLDMAAERRRAAGLDRGHDPTWLLDRVAAWSALRAAP